MNFKFTSNTIDFLGFNLKLFTSYGKIYQDREKETTSCLELIEM